VNPAQKRQVYLALASVIVALFGAGVAYWIVAGQHHQICADGRPPLQQRDDGMGQLTYRCHNGQIVTGSILP
jgi:hypothetical protein